MRKYCRNTLKGCEEGGGERPEGEVGDVGLRFKWNFQQTCPFSEYHNTKTFV